MLQRWEIYMTIVPGFLFGYRNYVNEDSCSIEHVLYLGIIDVSLILYYDC